MAVPVAAAAETAGKQAVEASSLLAARAPAVAEAGTAVPAARAAAATVRMACGEVAAHAVANAAAEHSAMEAAAPEAAASSHPAVQVLTVATSALAGTVGLAGPQAVVAAAASVREGR